MTNSRFIWVKRGLAAILAYAFLLSLNHIILLWPGGYAGYGVNLFGFNIWAVILYIFSCRLLYRLFQRNNKRLHFVSLGIGFLLSLAIVYGSYAHHVNDIFSSTQTTLLQFALVFGFLFITMPLSEEILLLLDRLPAWYSRNTESSDSCLERFFAKTKIPYFFWVWLFIFLSYIPIFLGWWPGNFVYDAPFQMSEVIYGTYQTHHPLLHTLLMGWAYNLGRSCGDASSGYQLYTLIQMLILSGAFAYCANYLHKKRMPKCFRIGVILWFAWFPLHAIFSISSTKDIMFSAFFLCLIVFMVRLLYDKECFKWYSYMGLIINGILCVLMRNNALYSILAGGVIILIFQKEKWQARVRIVLLLLAIVIGSNAINTGLIAATDATDTDSYRESLSVPLQCLARVASYRNEDLASELYDEICMYIREEDIEKYNPYLADHVKYLANEDLLRENFVNFVKLWIKVGLQFPDEYIESIVTNTMGYWYPLDMGTYVMKPMEFYHKLIYISDDIEKRALWPAAFRLYNDLFWSGKYFETPILGYTFRLDGWIWFFHYFLAWCIYRKDRYAGLMGAIPFMYLGTCYLGPVPILRYIYCLIVIIPLLLYMVTTHKNEMEEQTS